ncbi:MAG: rhodanese-like domain-containing protein [Steroidobacteraceae bacterium]
MDRFLEYLNHHPYLAGGALIVAIIAIGFELRQRLQGASGISINQAIALHNKGALILDVRSADEFATGHIVDARHIVLDKLADSLDSIKKYREKVVIVCCESGARSGQAASLLKTQGYQNVYNLSGGLAAWRQDNLPLSTKVSR